MTALIGSGDKSASCSCAPQGLLLECERGAALSCRRRARGAIGDEDADQVTGVGPADPARLSRGELRRHGESLGTTRANIHYHFGNKQSLVEEVLIDYVEATLAALKEVWMTSGLTLARKIEAMVEFSRKRYARYNPPGKKGRPWSLIARMRQDSDALDAEGPRRAPAVRQGTL